MLTLIKEKAIKGRRSEYKNEYLCSCGKTTFTEAWRVANGHTTSCGCYRYKRLKESLTTHGLSGPNNNLYNVWKSMRRRCDSNNSHAFNYYGARGIRVCNEWNDYFVFHSWCNSNGYAQGLQIDRIDNNGNYCPENCRWTTAKINSENKRSCIGLKNAIEIRKKLASKISIIKLSKEYGVSRATIRFIKQGKTYNT